MSIENPSEKPVTSSEEQKNDVLTDSAQKEQKIKEEIVKHDEEIKMMDPKETDDYLIKLEPLLKDASHFSTSAYDVWKEVGDIELDTPDIVNMSAMGTKQRLQYLFNNSPIWAKVGHLQILGKVEVKFVIEGRQLCINVTSRNLSGSEGYKIPIVIDKPKQ